jgi:hypothetical protein
MNGQEKSDEIFKGVLTAEFWEYDSRIGRRWNIDPIFKEWESPFACFYNNPTNILDPFGLDGEGPNGECPGDISEDGTKTYGLDGTTLENRWHDNSYGVTIVENKNVSNNDWRALTRSSITNRLSTPAQNFNSKKNFEIKVPELEISLEKREPYTGLTGTIEYFWTGGNENGTKYDWDGNPIGPSPITGTTPVPNFSAVKIKDILKTSQALQKAARKGRAPKEIDRVDIPKLDPNGNPIWGQKPHVHYKEFPKRAFNLDGTWKHGEGTISNKIIEWINSLAK